MRHNIIRLPPPAVILSIVFLATTLLIGCNPNPPSGVNLEKQILIIDTGKTVTSESEAASLVQNNLGVISEAKLIRIAGEINKDTLININAEKFNEGEDFSVHIEYRHPQSKMEGDTGKVVVTVTGKGKIFGMTSAQ